MAATFDPSLSRPLDLVRVRVGDNDTTGGTGSPIVALASSLVPDETIIALLGTKGESETCAILAEQFVAKYATKPDELDQQGVVTVSWRSRVDGWLKLIKLFRSNPDPSGNAGAASSIQSGLMTLPDTSKYL